MNPNNEPDPTGLVNPESSSVTVTNETTTTVAPSQTLELNKSGLFGKISNIADAFRFPGEPKSPSQSTTATTPTVEIQPIAQTVPETTISMPAESPENPNPTYIQTPNIDVPSIQNFEPFTSATPVNTTERPVAQAEHQIQFSPNHEKPQETTPVQTIETPITAESVTPVSGLPETPVTSGPIINPENTYQNTTSVSPQLTTIEMPAETQATQTPLTEPTPTTDTFSTPNLGPMPTFGIDSTPPATESTPVTEPSPSPIVTGTETTTPPPIAPIEIKYG